MNALLRNSLEVGWAPGCITLGWRKSIIFGKISPQLALGGLDLGISVHYVNI